MRKKLLRSRTGFEKPESREEAIMQNILGASNVLEPSESNIEEILKSILYNTPYTKEAEFEIEKILLAIKNNGTYDGEGESRDMKILIAILNDLDYTEEAESRIEELFIEWLHQRSSIKVLEGVPPLTFTSRGLPLINYLIEGNTIQNGTPTPQNPVDVVGTGERTGNLFPQNSLTGRTSVVRDAFNEIASFIAFNNGQYVISMNITTEPTTGIFKLCFTYTDDSQDKSSWITKNTPTMTFASNSAKVVKSISITDYNNFTDITLSNIMLNRGSTAKPYEPYGYKIPISMGGTTTPVYLGEVQAVRQIKKLVLTGKESDWRTSGDGAAQIFNHTIGLYADLQPYAKSNMFYQSNNAAGYNNSFDIIRSSGNGVIRFNNSGIATTTSDWKAYLAQQYTNGTPVTVWYVLVTPTTGIVNEPLMRIGDYADTLSMEQAGVEIPTASGSNTLDVDTTVKPSNVYIEYK